MALFSEMLDVHLMNVFKMFLLVSVVEHFLNVHITKKKQHKKNHDKIIKCNVDRKFRNSIPKLNGHVSKTFLEHIFC